MEVKKTGTGLKVLVGILSLLLLLAVGYIIVDKFVLNKKVEEKQTQVVEESKEETKETDSIVVSNDNSIYEKIIKLYESAVKGNNEDSNYEYLNKNALNHYFNKEEKDRSLNYSFHDINKDDKSEMIIDDGVLIIDIFTYQNNSIVRLFKEDADCMAESRCRVSIYDDGVIYMDGSQSANEQIISFYKINNNSSLESINKYFVHYEGDEINIYDYSSYDYEKGTGTKLSYKSVDDLKEVNIKSSQKIDFKTLDRKSFVN